MRILISGASGLVGSALASSLASDGHEVLRLVRTKTQESEGEVFWDISAGILDSSQFSRIDVVVHLSGENIAAGRWSKKQKDRILRSRVDSTRLIAETLATCAQRPKVLVVASAVGFYGNTGDATVDENASLGTGFLASVCEAWEDAAEAARHVGIRVVHARFGMILSKNAGALKKMLPLFRLGLGGRIADGKQWMSWIHIEDVVSAIKHCIEQGCLTGPVNFCSPNPVTNSEFTKALSQVLNRPAIFPVPAFILKLALGKMAEELLLSSTRAMPKKLLETSYKFRYSHIREALSIEISA